MQKEIVISNNYLINDLDTAILDIEQGRLIIYFTQGYCYHQALYNRINSTPK